MTTSKEMQASQDSETSKLAEDFLTGQMSAEEMLAEMASIYATDSASRYERATAEIDQAVREMARDGGL